MYSLYRTLSVRYHRRRASRAALVIISIALGVATLVSTQSLNRCMEAAARAAAAPAAGAADLTVGNGEAGVRRALAVDLRAVPGLRTIVPLLVERVQLSDLDNRLALLLGVERPDTSDTQADLFGVSFQITNLLALGSAYPVLVGESLNAELPPGPVRIRTNGQNAELARLGTVRLTGPAAEFGKNLLVLDIDRAANLLGRPETVSRIDLFLKSDADPVAVRRAVEQVVAGRALVQTPEASVQSVSDVIAGVQVGFALCGAGALVVGLFLVYNALAVSVAERRHDIGVLRSIGATRGQVAALFAGEAFMLGLIGALAGLPLGIGFARLALGPMQQVLSEVFLAVEASAVPWNAGILFIALAAGVVTALVAALVPALQAAADAPADAVRRTPAGSARLFRRLHGLTSLVLILAGIAVAFGRAALPPRVGSYGGVVLMLVGGVLAAPLFTALGAKLIRPLTWLVPGVGARLAVDNLLRSPGRTGFVAAALAAGVGMSVQIAGVAASNERPVLAWIDQSMTADLFVLGGDTASATSSQMAIDPNVADDLRRLPDIREVVPVRFRRPTYRGTIILVIGFDARRFHAANRDRPDYPGLDLFPRLTDPGTAIVSENFAALHGISPGDTVTLQGANGPNELRVVGSIPDYSWNRGTVFIDRSTLKRVFDDDRVDICDVFLDAVPRAAAIGTQKVQEFASHHSLAVATRADLRGYIADVIHRLYALVQVQQLVVGVVAALGVVTALLISVLQRRRELGLLRAVGATRAQVLRSVLAEAALMGLFGTLFGLALGVPIEWYMIRVVIWEEGGFLFPLVVPWFAALGVAALSMTLATLAGVGPALQAMRLNIAEAVTVE
jgi:putative ABC transport system permease protein